MYVTKKMSVLLVLLFLVLRSLIITFTIKENLKADLLFIFLLTSLLNYFLQNSYIALKAPPGVVVGKSLGVFGVSKGV